MDSIECHIEKSEEDNKELETLDFGIWVAAFQDYLWPT